MLNIKTLLTRLRKEEDGAEVIELGLYVGGILLASIALFAGISGDLLNVYQTIADTLGAGAGG